MSRPALAHVYINAADGTVILRPAGLDDRMAIATHMSAAGYPTIWSRYHRGYEITGGTWPDVEALLTTHGVRVEAPRLLRTGRGA